MNPLSRVRTGSAVRGAGVALACLLPGLPTRAEAVAASYAAAWPLSKPGLQVFSVVPDEDAEPWKRAVVPLATSGASWTVVMLVATSVVRRSRVPTPVAAVLLGGAVTVGDSLLADLAEKMKSRMTDAAVARDAEGSGASAGSPG
jgi:hypothetical protein